MKRSHVEAAEEHKAASKFQELVELHGSVEAAWKVVGKRNMIRGTGWLLGGSILSGAYYMIAVQQANETGRGTYWFLTGALVVGIGQFVLGLRQYFRRA